MGIPSVYFPSLLPWPAASIIAFMAEQHNSGLSKNEFFLLESKRAQALLGSACVWKSKLIIEHAWDSVFRAPGRISGIMHVTFAASFPWWPCSDPLITFVKFCSNRGISCSIVASPIQEFIRSSFPSEPEFSAVHITETPSIEDFSACLARDRDIFAKAADYRVVFMDEASFSACCTDARSYAAKIFLYSSEIPENPSAVPADFPSLFSDTKAGLIIQDENRLALFEKRFGVRASETTICPNANLESCDYSVSRPKNLNLSDGERFILFCGTLYPEHCPVEMAQAFLNSRPGYRLLVQGWGEKAASQIRGMCSGRKDVIVSTEYLSGPEIRWLFSRCYAGFVSYTNSLDNHRMAGMSSGKLFWLGRYKKPLICNDNESVSQLTEMHKLGVQAENFIDFELLENKYDFYSANMQRFFSIASERAQAALEAVFRSR